MGLFDRFRPVSPEKRGLQELAELAGRKEALIKRLKRHAAMCPYPAMNKDLEAIAEKQEELFDSLRGCLMERDMWPRPPESLPREGLNSWERLSGDLEMLLAQTVGFQRASVIWEPIDGEVADRLMAIASADGECETMLRKIAAKCDPQALD